MSGARSASLDLVTFDKTVRHQLKAGLAEQCARAAEDYKGIVRVVLVEWLREQFGELEASAASVYANAASTVSASASDGW